jgi:hypothetical protein
MEDKQLKEELFKEIKRRGLLEQEDDSEEDIEETEDEDGELYKLPSKTIKILIEIIHGAYKMELALMKAYNKDSQELFSDDMTTFDFLTEFREIQKGAVVEYNDLINGSELVDIKDKFQVLYFEQTYF